MVYYSHYTEMPRAIQAKYLPNWEQGIVIWRNGIHPSSARRRGQARGGAQSIDKVTEERGYNQK